MERKFKITVEGREYNVSVEELTDSIPYSEPPVFLPPSAHLAPTIAPARSMNNHGPATSQLNHAAAEAGDVVSTLSGVVEVSARNGRTTGRCRGARSGRGGDEDEDADNRQTGRHSVGHSDQGWRWRGAWTTFGQAGLTPGVREGGLELFQEHA